MYTYGEIAPKTFSQVLDLYSQEDIFRIVFEEYPDYNKNYLSPFRADRNPNCFFDWYKGKLYFRDYADVQRDCFMAVKDAFNLKSYAEVIRTIYEYYQQNKPFDKVQFKEYREKCNDFHDIITQGRRFELRDNLFWKQYYITEQQLIDDSVYPISKYRFYAQKRKDWITIVPYDIAYSISGFERCKKIYRPKMKGKAKWLTNCSNNEIGNIQNVSRKEGYLIITKSYKDHRVIRNDGFSNTIWFQSESQFPNEELLFNTIGGYHKIIIFYDNDAAGIEGSAKLAMQIKGIYSSAKVVEVKSPFRFFKDPASIVSNKSREELHTLLWKAYQV